MATVRSLCVEEIGTLDYPDRMLRAVLAPESGPEVEVWTRHRLFEAALGAALVANLDASVSTQKHGDVYVVERIDVRASAPPVASKGERAGQENPVPSDCGRFLLMGAVDQINFESKATFLGVEIVAAAFVPQGDVRVQVFADDPGHVAALLGALSTETRLFIWYDDRGGVKVVRKISTRPFA